MPRAPSVAKTSSAASGEYATHTTTGSHGTPGVLPPLGQIYQYKQHQTHRTTSNNLSRKPSRQRQHQQGQRNNHNPKKATRTTATRRQTNSPTSNYQHSRSSTTSPGMIFWPTRTPPKPYHNSAMPYTPNYSSKPAITLYNTQRPTTSKKPATVGNCSSPYRV